LTKKLISFITVVYNDAEGLERTLKSVLDQKTEIVEHVVIDGLSTDKTLAVIKRYGNHIEFWVSEPDRGIYDAMNKGLLLANGAWICMLNAGDVLEHDVIQTVINKLKSGNSNSVYFGDAYYYYPDLAVKRNVPGNSDRLLEAMSICHQAVFVPAAVHDCYGKYSLDFECAADFHFFLRLRLFNVPFVHIKIPIVTFFAGGTSDRRMLKSRIESIKILWRLGSPRALKGTLRYIYEVVQQYVYSGLKKIIGENYAAQLRKNFFVKSK